MLTAGTKQGTFIAWLFWVRAKNRTTGAFEQVAFWTGPQDQTFTIPGAGSRVYAAMSIIEIEPFNFNAGVNNIQAQTIRLNGINDQVERAIRLYDVKQSDVEIHRLRQPADNPLATNNIELAFRGKIDEVSFERTEADLKRGGTTQTCVVGMMSTDRNGTRTLHLKKSDATQRMINANDGGRRYSSSKAKVTWMGETKDPHLRGKAAVAHSIFVERR